MLSALIVDNSPRFCEQLKTLLLNAGFSVDIAETGKQGLDKARQQHYRLVCSADNLPDYSSSELCSVIRSINGYEFSTFLVLAEQDDANLLKQALLAGATDLFNKHDLSDMETYLGRLTQRETRQLTGRVLFIEDSRVLQTIVLDLLTDMGLDVDAYNDAESAWEAFQGGDYDLVITDIMLEGSTSGLTLIRKIRRMQSECGNVPIIATSGYDNVSRKIELFHLGVNDYVSKPIVREELKQRVYNHITSYQATRELRLQQQSLFSLAMLDEDTGLFNRHALREFAGKFLSEAYRFDRTLSLAVVDIDQMKRLNHAHGYDRGTQMLKELGTWLKRHIRDIDMVARWAGDEIVILLPGCDLNDANKMMARIMEQLRRFRPADIAVSVSVGIAELRRDQEDTLNSLFEMADRAMYQAKMAGRNCVVVSQQETRPASVE